MKSVVIIVLSVFLAAALVSDYILYGKYVDEKDAFFNSEKKLSDLNKKVSALDQEISSLHNQIRGNTQRLKDYESAQKRISELENTINAKDQEISKFEARFRRSEKDFKKEGEIKDAMVSGLQAQLDDAQSYIIYLDAEIAKKLDTLEGLEGRLMDTAEQKISVESRMSAMKSAYESLLSDLKEQIENQEVTIKTFKEKISVSFVDRVLFGFARTTITPEGREILDRVGEVLKKVKDRKIRIIGHTDNIAIRPEYQYKFPSNWELSAARAAAVVRNFQETIGLDPKNMEAVGHSFYTPVATNDTDEGRAQNRRVEIIIAPK